MNEQRPELETLMGLLHHFSPTGMEQECVSFLVGWMRSLGYDKSYVDEVGNAVGIMGKGEKQIVLLGHIDTVNGQLPVKVEDGMVTGRGSVDRGSPTKPHVLQPGGSQSSHPRVVGAAD